MQLISIASCVFKEIKLWADTDVVIEHFAEMFTMNILHLDK